jgi:hypothetical protein
VYKGGITRLKLHLAHIPKCNVKKCENVPADVKAEMIELLAKKNIIKEKMKNSRGQEMELTWIIQREKHQVKKMVAIMLLFTQGELEAQVAPKVSLWRGSASPLQKKLLLQSREQALAIRCRPSCQLRKEKRGEIKPMSASTNSFMKPTLHTIQ